MLCVRRLWLRATQAACVLETTMYEVVCYYQVGSSSCNHLLETADESTSSRAGAASSKVPKMVGRSLSAHRRRDPQFRYQDLRQMLVLELVLRLCGRRVVAATPSLHKSRISSQSAKSATLRRWVSRSRLVRLFALTLLKRSLTHSSCRLDRKMCEAI
jgi:hypothetical protein